MRLRPSPDPTVSPAIPIRRKLSCHDDNDGPNLDRAVVVDREGGSLERSGRAPRAVATLSLGLSVERSGGPAWDVVLGSALCSNRDGRLVLDVLAC